MENKDKQRRTAYEAAMSLLAVSDLSERRLREKLKDRSYGDEEIACAVEELRDAGYLNEERCFYNCVRYYAEKKHYGAYRIRAELMKKFDRSSVEAWFDDAVSGIDFEKIALEYCEKNVSENDDPVKTVRKLQRQGFSAAEIRRVLR